MLQNIMKKISVIAMIIILTLLPSIALASGTPVIDCYFDDWEDKPHTELHKGKDVNYGSLFLDEGILYGHLKLTDSRGKSFPGTPMTLIINNQYKVKFFILSKNGDNDLYAGNNVDLGVFENSSKSYLGDAAIMITGNKHRAGDEAEFSIDLKNIREYCGNASLDELRTFTLSVPNIGKEDITITGTSTAPYLGITLAIASIGIIVLVRNRNNKRLVN